MTKFLNISTDTTLGGNSPSDSTVSSQKAIKTLIDTKQDTLVSGTNIKTVNNVSLLGSGNITIGGGTPGQQGTFNLFDFKWADHELSDMAWLRADTFSWQPGSTYSNAYNHLVADINGKTLQSETIAGTTIQFYLANDGHKICPVNQESNVAAIYTATGVAWYYILDTANTRFKLPRSNHNKYATTNPVVGTGMTLGLITDTDVGYGLKAFSSSGEFRPSATAYGKSVGDTGADYNTITKSYGITTDPDKSGVVAQQTQDTDQYKYLYFYVGEFTQTAIENTAGLNAALFNAKIDIANNSTVTASDALNSVVTTTGITKSSSGYVKLGNGLIVQWVRQQGTQNQNQDVTLPIAFTSADSFTATATIFGTAESMYPVSIQAQTATTVQLHRYTGGLSAYYFNIIAIGY